VFDDITLSTTIMVALLADHPASLGVPGEATNRHCASR
jgi:hypothetical protein